MNISFEPALDPQFIQDHVYKMNTVGYSLVPDFFSPEVCEYLKVRLQKAVDEYKPLNSERSEKDRYNLHDLLSRDLAFGKTLEDPRLQQLVAPLIGDAWIMYAYTSSSLPPQGVNYGSRMHVDSPRWLPNYPTNIGLLWALDDFTADNGGTFVLPASHHLESTPPREYFDRESVRITCKKGSLFVFNARVWHRAGENKTDHWRHALTMNVCRSYMKQRCDWVRFTPASITDNLNAQARRIIGFDTRLPASLEELFLPEEQRLYKANQG